MWNAQPTLTDQYFVSSFISGLKDELRSMVKMMMPTTVRQAIEKARLQELTLEVVFKRNRVVTRPISPHNSLVGGTTRALVVGGTSGGTKANPPPFRSTTMEQRRLMGLCYWCGEKYSLRHLCRRELMNMEGE